MILKFAPCVTEKFATGCSYVDERTRKKQCRASPRAIHQMQLRTRLRKGAPRLGIWACCIFTMSKIRATRSLILAKKYKNGRKKCNFLPSAPSAAKLPGSHRYRPDRKADALLPLLSDRNSPLSPITVTLYAHSANEFFTSPSLRLRDTRVLIL